jgi:hypothetical protein
MSVKDRGHIGQNDISLKGIIYEQLISDEHNITDVLHFESGQWLWIPETTVPLKKDTVARQATILHGVSFTATGDAPPLLPIKGKPNIITTNTTPTGPQVAEPRYLDQFHNAPLLAGLPEGSVQDPSLILRHRMATQMVVETVTFDVAAQLSADKEENCGISNIPFLDRNAQVTGLRSVFYVEHIEDDGGSFMQLQYIQIVPLFFDNIIWPHVSVATLKRVLL